MRTLVFLFLFWTALVSSAGDRRSGAQVDVFVPVEPHEHERLHYFDNRAHHLLPGTVTINGKGYFCDPHSRSFAAPDEFVAHLRTAHKIPTAEIRERLVVRDGGVHFPK